MSHSAEKDAPIPDGTEVRCRPNVMPGVSADTVAIVRHESPAGRCNLPGVYWLELPEPIRWSHGTSESAGFWATAAEFTRVTPPGEDWEAEKRAASGVDDPWDESDETPLPSDLGAC